MSAINLIESVETEATEQAQDVAILADKLNEMFDNLSYTERIEKLYSYFHHDDVLLTSSFGSNSIFLLHLFNTINKKQKVHFLDTTFHFKETIQYKREISNLLDLKIIDLFPTVEDNLDARNGAWWVDNADQCCNVNKVKPLQKILSTKRVWVSGVMGFQTPHRSKLRIFEPSGDMLKFHPIIDIDEAEMLYQIGVNNLPAHPLLAHGYSSIGCTHCTEKGEGRDGRWNSQSKTECGLHTTPITDTLKNQENA